MSYTYIFWVEPLSKYISVIAYSKEEAKNLIRKHVTNNSDLLISDTDIELVDIED